MMRAIMVEQPGQPLVIANLPDPDPDKGEAVIRVGRCGICSSDLHMAEAHGFGFPAGAVPGHEFSGEVVALGKGTSGLSVGDRVSVLPARTCGRCAPCLSGTPFACVAGSRTIGIGPVRGGYAEYAVADARWCFRLPDALGMDDGALIEPLAVGLHGVRLASIRPGDRVLVIGAGPVGLAVVYWLRRSEAARVVVTASSRTKQATAEAMGADAFVVPAPGETLADAAFAALGGKADVVIECAGVPGMIDGAVSCTARGGTIVVLGICMSPDPINAFPAVLNEVTIRFAFAFDAREFRAAIDALDRGWIAPRALITGSVGLAETPAMFEALRTARDHIKVMIDPWRADAA